MLFFLVLLQWFSMRVSSHMSMDFPIGRLPHSIDTRRNPINGGLGMCHSKTNGYSENAVINQKNVFSVGQSITLEFSKTRAPHGGGHCALWWSKRSSTVFHKIIDLKDCTIKEGNKFVMPSTMDATCGDRCVLAWTWIPRFSGSCEVYMNCADIKVNGNLVGPSSKDVTKDFNIYNNGFDCTRIDNQGFSSTFGALMLSQSTNPNPPTNKPITSNPNPPTNKPITNPNPPTNKPITNQNPPTNKPITSNQKNCRTCYVTSSGPCQNLNNAVCYSKSNNVCPAGTTDCSNTKSNPCSNGSAFQKDSTNTGNKTSDMVVVLFIISLFVILIQIIVIMYLMKKNKSKANTDFLHDKDSTYKAPKV